MVLNALGVFGEAVEAAGFEEGTEVVERLGVEIAHATSGQVEHLFQLETGELIDHTPLFDLEHPLNDGEWCGTA